MFALRAIWLSLWIIEIKITEDMPNLFTNKQTLNFYIIVPPKMF